MANEYVPHIGAPLSPRELEVLRLICDGRSTKQLAGELGIAYKTAVAHRTHILEKTNTHDPISLFRWALLHDVVRIPGPPKTVMARRNGGLDMKLAGRATPN